MRNYLNYLNPFRKGLPNGRKSADPAARHAERAKLAAEAAEAKALADSKAADYDNYCRENYFWFINSQRTNAAIAAGAALGSAESHVNDYPPPTPEQWAKLTPEQKASPGSVLPDKL